MAATVAEWGGPYAPWARGLGLLILITVTALTVPGNPVLDLNNRQYREPGTILAHAGALLFLVGLLPSAPRGLAAIAALSPARRLALLGAATVAPLAALGLISLGWPALRSPAAAREVQPRLAKGGPPSGVMGTGAVIGSRP